MTSTTRNGQVADGLKSNDNAGAFANRPERSAPTITLAANAPEAIAYVRFDNPTPEVPDGDPIGYTYQADNITGPDLVETLIRQGRLSPGARGMRVEEALDQLAEVEDINRESLISFDSDQFPKPVEADQLTCSDEWAGDYAPEHVASRTEFPECIRCGKEMPAEVAYEEDEEYEDVLPEYDTSHIDRDALLVKLAQLRAAGDYADQNDVRRTIITWAAAWTADNVPGATELVFSYDDGWESIEDDPEPEMNLLYVNSVNGWVNLHDEKFGELQDIAGQIFGEGGFPARYSGLDACVSIADVLNAARE